ncbi:sulfate permease [Microbacterium sp. Sa4CUA7]|uniref:Sulfate permease n=1 Tax=Microbacterium pullorum TaxID=2762236 RepID=A0ABR8S5I0_9MICO|nr:sulfate permease [Microbacterium pullorum]MBD7958639.1 sulfate permease [Microbacterium pullorum]
MFQVLIAFVSRIYAYFQRSMPTNILVRATHTRRGLKWGVPAMLLAVVYIVIAAALAQWVADGAPGWINLLVLLCLWNALKFAVNGPATAVRLTRVRARERRYRDDIRAARPPETPVDDRAGAAGPR